MTERDSIQSATLPDGYKFDVAWRLVPIRNAAGERIGWSRVADSVAIVKVIAGSDGWRLVTNDTEVCDE